MTPRRTLPRLTRALATALVLGACLPAAPSRSAARHPAYTTYARITGYECPPYCGLTASGAQVQLGLAACSYDIPLGATVVIAGDAYLCADRGLLGSGSPYSWIDLFAGADASWVPATYGDYQFVEVQ